MLQYCYAVTVFLPYAEVFVASNIQIFRISEIFVSEYLSRGLGNCRYYDTVSDNIFHFRVPEKVIFSLFFDVFRQLEDFIDLFSVRKFMITIAIAYPRIIC